MIVQDIRQDIDIQGKEDSNDLSFIYELFLSFMKTNQSKEGIENFTYFFINDTVNNIVWWIFLQIFSLWNEFIWFKK